MKFNPIKHALIALVFISMLASCEYEVIEIAGPPPLPPIDTTDTSQVIHYTSFANVIEPIFTEVTCTGCHGGGSNSLNLTAGNAYASIMSIGAAVAGDPENSTIYTLPKPGTGDHYKLYQTQAQADSIYKWIWQGAKNN
jgi:hypothetical protein